MPNVQNKTIDHFAIFSANCLRCSHLVDGEANTIEYAACHFSKGNRHCPAEAVKVVIVGKALSLAERVHKARLARNTALEAKLLGIVSKKSEAFKASFYTHLEKL